MHLLYLSASILAIFLDLLKNKIILCQVFAKNPYDIMILLLVGRLHTKN